MAMFWYHECTVVFVLPTFGQFFLYVLPYNILRSGICVKYFLSFPQKKLSPEKLPFQMSFFSLTVNFIIQKFISTDTCFVLTGLISVAQKRLSVEHFAVTRVLKVHSTERRQFMTRWTGKLFYTHSEIYESS